MSTINLSFKKQSQHRTGNLAKTVTSKCERRTSQNQMTSHAAHQIICLVPKDPHDEHGPMASSATRLCLPHFRPYARYPNHFQLLVVCGRGISLSDHRRRMGSWIVMRIWLSRGHRSGRAGSWNGRCHTAKQEAYCHTCPPLYQDPTQLVGSFGVHGSDSGEAAAQ